MFLNNKKFSVWFPKQPEFRFAFRPTVINFHNGKIFNRLSERLTPLSKIGTQSREPLKPLGDIHCRDVRGGCREAFKRAPRHAALSDSCTPDPCSFSSNVPSHTEKSFRNPIKSNRNQIIFTIFRLVWNNKRTLSICCSKQIGKWWIQFYFGLI